MVSPTQAQGAWNAAEECAVPQAVGQISRRLQLRCPQRPGLIAHPASMTRGEIGSQHGFAVSCQQASHTTGVAATNWIAHLSMDGIHLQKEIIQAVPYHLGTTKPKVRHIALHFLQSRPTNA